MKRFLKEQKSDKTVKDATDLVSNIESANIAKQQQNEQEVAKQEERKVIETQANTEAVKANLGDMEKIA